MIIGLSGLAGSGKDVVADILVKNHHLIKVALADPLKRICKEVYDFSDEQLWGPSEKRNEPDMRYPRQQCGGCQTCEFRCDHYYCLTPRYALQLLGTEWGRRCYENTWVGYALRVAKEIMDGGFVYSAQKGLESEYGHEGSPQFPYRGVVIPDVRFKNEIAAIKKASGKVVRIKRTGFEKPAFDHTSETEQMEVLDSEFDSILLNDSTISSIEEKIGTILGTLK